MSESDSISTRFIDDPIEVEFHQPPLLEKKPVCPDSFIWQDEVFIIEALLAEWKDFRRKGRMARNMIPAHADRASRTGSWGVGRFFFRVRVENGRIFDIYYDRSPQSADDRKGKWVLFSERFLE
jgi:hypothetical protein